jgi:hypothetical protein
LYFRCEVIAAGGVFFSRWPPGHIGRAVHFIEKDFRESETAWIIDALYPL